jgi:hypothetical protein
VIQVPEAVFASAAGAADTLDASLDHLATVDWASLGTAAHAEMLARLQRAQAKMTAVNAAVLSAFTAQSGMSRTGTGRRGRGWSAGPGSPRARPGRRWPGRNGWPGTRGSPR